MSTLLKSPARDVLARLHADASANDPQHIGRVREQLNLSPNTVPSGLDFYKLLNQAYLPISPAFGTALNMLVHFGRPRTIVEFGTSFGISTIYLAAGLRDIGGGKLITAEFEAGKSERARANLAEAGLADLVDFRLGDASETLSRDMPEIDMLFLDGAKHLYQPLLHMLEPKLRAGALIAADNTDMEGMDSYLAYVTETNGYATVDLATGKGNTISVRHA